MRDLGDSFATLTLAISSLVLEIWAAEICDSNEKGQFPEKRSNFRQKFVVQLNITRIAFEDLFITIKIRPRLTILVNLTGSYGTLYVVRY